MKSASSARFFNVKGLVCVLGTALKGRTKSTAISPIEDVCSISIVSLSSRVANVTGDSFNLSEDIFSSFPKFQHKVLKVCE